MIGGIALIILGAIPILYGIWRLFRLDPAAFVFAVSVTAAMILCLLLIFHGVEVVTR